MDSDQHNVMRTVKSAQADNPGTNDSIVSGKTVAQTAAPSRPPLEQQAKQRSGGKRSLKRGSDSGTNSETSHEHSMIGALNQIKETLRESEVARRH